MKLRLTVTVTGGGVCHAAGGGSQCLVRSTALELLGETGQRPSSNKGLVYLCIQLHHNTPKSLTDTFICHSFTSQSQLKAWIDHICIKGKTFDVNEQGLVGLCKGKRVILVSASGGLYGPGSPFEQFNHQTTYLQHLLQFLGVTDIQSIKVEGVSYGLEKTQAGMQEARRQISQLKA